MSSPTDSADEAAFLTRAILESFLGLKNRSSIGRRKRGKKLQAAMLSSAKGSANPKEQNLKTQCGHNFLHLKFWLAGLMFAAGTL